MAKDWRPFRQARAWAHSLKLPDQKAWHTFAKGRIRLPADIPTNPNAAYKGRGWRGYGDWLGTGRLSVVDKSKQWRPFAGAREWARALKLTGQAAWNALARKRLPDDIPTNPQSAYPEFAGMEDWLGLPPIWGTSDRERRIRYEIAALFPGETLHRTVRETDGRRWKVDISLPSRRLIVEYDGWYWHRENVAMDETKSTALRRNGFRVIRIRERPLPRLHSDDVFVDPRTPVLQCVQRVVRRLLRARRWSADEKRALEAYLQRAEPLCDPPPPLGWRPFDEARSWARSLGLSGSAAWHEFARDRVSLPDDIPASPHYVYAQLGWIDMADWLGTGKVSIRAKSRTWLSFEEARDWARSLKLSGSNAWAAYVKTPGNLRPGVPTNPQRTYRYRGWAGWGDWLGTGAISVAKQNANWRPFAQARKWARSLGLRNWDDWQEFAKGRKNLPLDIPVKPNNAYAGRGWVDWSDWLGTATRSNREISLSWRPFRDARKWARSLKLAGPTAWQTFARGRRNLPPDIPTSPDSAYRNRGWVNWRDWLGATYRPNPHGKPNARIAARGSGNRRKRGGRRPL